MSESGKDPLDIGEKDETELITEIEENCWEAFCAFDTEQQGIISSNQLKYVIEMMGIKLKEKELFALVGELDPDN